MYDILYMHMHMHMCKNPANGLGLAWSLLLQLNGCLWLPGCSSSVNTIHVHGFFLASVTGLGHL